MAWEPISFADSSNVNAAIYDADSQQLMIEYSRGHVYRFENVSGEMASGLSQAQSATKYLEGSIKPLCTYKRVK